MKLFKSAFIRAVDRKRFQFKNKNQEIKTNNFLSVVIQEVQPRGTAKTLALPQNDSQEMKKWRDRVFWQEKFEGKKIQSVEKKRFRRKFFR